MRTENSVTHLHTCTHTHTYTHINTRTHTHTHLQVLSLLAVYGRAIQVAVWVVCRLAAVLTCEMHPMSGMAVEDTAPLTS